jgi:hypothetical protein
MQVPTRDGARIQRAVERARSLVLDELRIETPEQVDVGLIAAHLGVFTQLGDLADEEAHLLRGRDHGLVTLARRICGTPKWLRVLAHEIGHWVLHPDLDDFKRCTGIGSKEERDHGQPYEREASAFSEELCFTRPIMEPLCRAERPTLHDVSIVSDRFRASLSATGIRYTHLSPAACAVACVDARGRIAWRAHSASFVRKLEKGSLVGGAGYARLAIAGERPPDAMLHVDARAWGLPGDVDLFEHTRAIGKGTALSLLWHPAARV